MQQANTQVKVSVRTETAVAFKEVCRIANLSMTSVLSEYMDQYCNRVHEKKGYAPDLATRRQRRAVVHSILQQLQRVLSNEEYYCGRIPENFQNSEVFERATESISVLTEALEILETAY